MTVGRSTGSDLGGPLKVTKVRKPSPESHIGARKIGLRDDRPCDTSGNPGLSQSQAESLHRAGGCYNDRSCRPTPSKFRLVRSRRHSAPSYRNADACFQAGLLAPGSFESPRLPNPEVSGCARVRRRLQRRDRSRIERDSLLIPTGTFAMLFFLSNWPVQF